LCRSGGGFPFLCAVSPRARARAPTLCRSGGGFPFLCGSPLALARGPQPCAALVAVSLFFAWSPLALARRPHPCSRSACGFSALFAVSPTWLSVSPLRLRCSPRARARAPALQPRFSLFQAASEAAEGRQYVRIPRSSTIRVPPGLGRGPQPYSFRPFPRSPLALARGPHPCSRSACGFSAFFPVCGFPHLDCRFPLFLCGVPLALAPFPSELPCSPRARARAPTLCRSGGGFPFLCAVSPRARAKAPPVLPQCLRILRVVCGFPHLAVGFPSSFAVFPSHSRHSPLNCHVPLALARGPQPCAALVAVSLFLAGLPSRSREGSNLGPPCTSRQRPKRNAELHFNFPRPAASPRGTGRGGACCFPHLRPVSSAPGAP
jgi:hypothetical protein